MDCSTSLERQQTRRILGVFARSLLWSRIRQADNPGRAFGADSAHLAPCEDRPDNPAARTLPVAELQAGPLVHKPCESSYQEHQHIYWDPSTVSKFFTTTLTAPQFRRRLRWPLYHMIFINMLRTATSTARSTAR
jgi:hypothetical protein